MTPGHYIQWYLNPEEIDEVKKPFENYKQIKNSLNSSISMQTYSNAIKKRFKSNDIENIEYLKLASQLVNNTYFQTALNNAMEHLKIPEYTNRQVYALKELFKTNAKEYQLLITQLLDALTAIISFLGVADLDALSSKEAITSLHYLFKDNNSFNRIITKKRYDELSATAKGQYKSLLSSLSAFPEIQNATTANDTSIKIITKLLTHIQTLSGICTEFQIKDEINKLLEPLQKSFPGITIKTVGAEKSEGENFRVNTADLSFNLGKKQSNLTFNVPNLGISVKRTHKNLQQAKNVRIKLKGTTYGNLMKELNPYLVTCFYTIYANTKPKGQVSLPSGTLMNAYQYMKEACLIPALIGSINSEDLVVIFIINNQAYTIFDLLNRLANAKNNNSSVILMTPAFSTKHKFIVEQHKNLYSKTSRGKFGRSKNIRAKIDEISTSIILNLSSDVLNNKLTE